jgi:signal transduction histidine kinase
MAVEQAAGTPGGGGIWRVLGAPLQLRTWTATIYLLASMFVGLAWFTILSVGLTLGAGLLIIWVGVLVLALTLLAWRGGTWLERRWVRAMLGVHIPEPYRPIPPGSLWRRARVLAGDPATWKDLTYLILLFPLGIVWFVVTTTLWSFGLGGLTAPLWYWIPSSGEVALFSNGDRSYFVLDTLPEALLACLVGAALCVVAAWAVKAMATAHGALALALLGPSDSQLRARVEALQASRDRAVDSAEAERRRIERDLHDGAQQRLVGLRIKLELVEELLPSDPARGRELLHELGDETVEALEEVRSLAQGVYPALLARRGLADALREASLRSPIPTSLEHSGVGRYREAVESAVYFCCLEGLQNAAKHASGATRIKVALVDDGVLRFEVRDDGAGFDPATSSGAGLTNMRDRLAAVGGHLTVLSEDGEGTRVMGRVPVSPLRPRS